MAENTADVFYMASDAGHLTEIYNDINKKIDIETDSVPVVLGQITSGLVPIADARDVVANAVHGDWLIAGISAIGIVPALEEKKN